MPIGAAFTILLGCAVGTALACGLRLAGHELFPTVENQQAGLVALGFVAGAGGGLLAGGTVALSLRRLLLRPTAAMGIVVLIWAVVTGVDAAMWPAVVYKTPIALGAIHGTRRAGDPADGTPAAGRRPVARSSKSPFVREVEVQSTVTSCTSSPAPSR